MSQIIHPATAISTDRYFYPHDCRGRGVRTVRFQFSCVTTGAPVGVIKFEASEDPNVENDLLVLNGVSANYATTATTNETAKWVNLTLPSTAVIHGSGFTAPTLPTANGITWDQANGALSMWVAFEVPPCRVRCWWDRTSGGNASTLMYVWSSDEAT